MDYIAQVIVTIVVALIIISVFLQTVEGITIYHIIMLGSPAQKSILYLSFTGIVIFLNFIAYHMKL